VKGTIRICGRLSESRTARAQEDNRHQWNNLVS
jgi:hypothetical protein